MTGDRPPSFTPPGFMPKDPDFEARVRASFARQAIMDLIGARLTRVEPGLVEIELPYRADLTQQHGFFHAGITSTTADPAGRYAAYSLIPAEAPVLTTELKINPLAPAEGEPLRAVGRVGRGEGTARVAAPALAGGGRRVAPDDAAALGQAQPLEVLADDLQGACRVVDEDRGSGPRESASMANAPVPAYRSRTA